MARFFFHFFDGEARSDDEWGLELAGTEQAYLEAVAAARAMWPELLVARTDPTNCAFEVVDELGRQLFRLEFAELLDGCRDAPAPVHSREIIHRALEETHRRAATAREDLRLQFDEVYKSLGEASALLSKLNRLERPRSSS